MSKSEAVAAAAPVYSPIEVVNLAATTVFKMTADEARVAEISTAGALRAHQPFRRAFTDIVLGHSNEMEVYPLHLIALILENSDDELADAAELVASVDDGVVHLHVMSKPFQHFSSSNLEELSVEEKEILCFRGKHVLYNYKCTSLSHLEEILFLTGESKFTGKAIHVKARRVSTILIPDYIDILPETFRTSEESFFSLLEIGSDNFRHVWALKNEDRFIELFDSRIVDVMLRRILESPKASLNYIIE